MSYTVTCMWRASEVRHSCEWVMLHRWTSHVTRTSGNPNPVEAVTYNNIAVTLKRKGKFRTALQVCTLALFQVLKFSVVTYYNWAISVTWLIHMYDMNNVLHAVQKTTIVRWWRWLYCRSRRKNRVIPLLIREELHTHAYIYSHTYIHTPTNTRIRRCRYCILPVYIMCVWVSVCVWVCVYAYVYLCACVCVCVCMCMCMCTCVHVYGNTWINM